MGIPPNHPNLVLKPMVLGYPHFRKNFHISMLIIVANWQPSTLQGTPSFSGINSSPMVFSPASTKRILYVSIRFLRVYIVTEVVN